jgi:hypothetical protein
MKKFNLRIFIISFLVIGLLTCVSIIADEDVKKNGHGGLFLIFLAKSYWIICFPINILFWKYDYNFTPTFILVGLTFNALLESILIERLFYLRKKRKFPGI